MAIINKNLTTNLINFWDNAQKLPGWKKYHDKDLILLKSPANCSFYNSCLFPNNYTNIKLIENFFQNKNFYLLSNLADNIELTIPSKASYIVKEMQIKLGATSNFEKSKNIKIVSNIDEAYMFGRIVAEVFEIDIIDSFKFYEKIYNIFGSKLILYLYNGIAVGVGQLYIDDFGFGGIYVIGVVKNARSQGIANKIMSTCLAIMQEEGVELCGLNATIMGESLYKNLGFHEIRTLSYKIY